MQRPGLFPTVGSTFRLLLAFFAAARLDMSNNLVSRRAYASGLLAPTHQHQDPSTNILVLYTTGELANESASEPASIVTQVGKAH